MDTLHVGWDEMDDIYVPTPEDAILGTFDEHATDVAYDPWFPDAEAATNFPEDAVVPDGMSYEDWKAQK